MRQKTMRQKFHFFCFFCLILLLLPYVITVFVYGVEPGASGNDGQVFVKVEKEENYTASGFMDVFAERETVGIMDDAGKDSGVVEIPWEEYFIGVMAGEVPENAKPEFLKAQAVLVRTKLYRELASRTAEEGEDAAEGEKVLKEPYLDREEIEQKLREVDYDSFYGDLLQAMRDTENQVLFYQDTYAWAPFHQSSNGMTRSAQEVLNQEEYPYLALKECPLDKEAEDELQVITFEYQEIQERCRSFLVAVPEEDAGKTYSFSDFEILSYDSAGYVSQLRIGETLCTGDQFRDALSLASSAFTIKDADGRLRITTMGKGHGLGMSQWTARQMEEQGKTYEEILQYFFEGTTLVDGGEITTFLTKAE